MDELTLKFIYTERKIFRLYVDEWKTKKKAKYLFREGERERKKKTTCRQM